MYVKTLKVPTKVLYCSLCSDIEFLLNSSFSKWWSHYSENEDDGHFLLVSEASVLRPSLW